MKNGRITKNFLLITVISVMMAVILSVGVLAADADIDSISITAGGSVIETTEAVDPNVHEYIAILDNDVDVVFVKVAAAGEDATIRINNILMPEEGMEIEVPVSTKISPCVKLSIKITATQGYSEVTNIYNLSLYRKPDPSLSSLSLKFNEVEMMEDFLSDVTSYELNLGSEVDSLELSCVAVAGTDAKISFASGSFDEIDFGTSTVVLRVTVGSGTNYEVTKDYTISVHRSLDTSLKELTVIGNNEVDYSPLNFTGDVLNYLISVPNEVTSLTINAEEAVKYLESPASINISSTDLAVGTNIISVVVSRQDGSSTTYKLTVKRAAAGSNCSTLDDVKVYLPDGALIPFTPEFDKNVYAYSISVDNAIEYLNFNVTLTEIETETFLVNGNTDLQVGENTITIYVYAQDTTYSTYVFTVTRNEFVQKSNDATLSDMSVDGVMLVPGFTKENLLYALTVGNDITSLTVNAVASDEKATVVVAGADDLQVGENQVTVTVTAEDGTVQTYTITVTRGRLKNSDANLKVLYLVNVDTGDRIPLSPSFDTDVTEYTATAEDITSVRVRAGNRGENGIWILGKQSGSVQDLVVGENKLTITSKAEDGTKKVYTILLTVTASVEDPTTSDTEATLSSITLPEGIVLSPAFSSTIYEYSVTVENSVSNISIAGIPTSSKATVTNRDVVLIEGDNVVTLIVVSGDNSTSQTYTIHIYRTPSSKQLTGTLSINGELVPGSSLSVALEAETGATVTYAWYVSGVQVATGETYTVKSSDAGKMIYVVASGTGIYTGSVSSQVKKIEQAVQSTQQATEPETTEPSENAPATNQMPVIVIVLIVIGCIGLVVGFAFFIFGRKR